MGLDGEIFFAHNFYTLSRQFFSGWYDDDDDVDDQHPWQDHPSHEI